jgi:hypothetical protein
MAFVTSVAMGALERSNVGGRAIMKSTRSLRATATALAVAVIPAGTAIAAPLGSPQVLSTASAEMSLAAAGDRAGNAVVVLRPGFGEPVLFERPAAGGWSGPHPLPGTGLRPSLQVAAAGSGAAAIAWRNDAGGRHGTIEVVVREPGGTFGAPLAVVGRRAAAVRHPAVGVDARGGAVVAYEAGSARGAGRQRVEIEVALRRPGAAAFGRSLVVSGAPAAAPAVAVNEDGDAVVAWRRGTRVEAAAITGGRVGRTRILGRAYGGWNPSVAIASTGDAVVAWSSLRLDPRSRPGHPAFLESVAAALRRGAGRFGPPDILARQDAARYTRAAVGEDGRAVVAWPSGAPSAVLKAAIAPRGARRFAAATAVSPLPAPFDLALAAAPTGFVALWPIVASHPESGWQLALARPGAPLLDAGRVSDPFLEGYGVNAANAAVFGDRRGNVTAVWVQPPAVPPPAPPTPGTPAQAPPEWTLQAAEAIVLPPH